MSRLPAGTPIVVKPTNNVYTVLAGVAVLATLGAVIAVFVKASDLGFDVFRV